MKKKINKNSISVENKRARRCSLPDVITERSVSGVLVLHLELEL
jgi:hypothetical protein